VNEDPRILLQHLWVPDLEIYGLEKAQTPLVIKAMSGIRIGRKKDIEYNQRSLILRRG